MANVVATLEPDTAAKIMHVRMQVHGRPPWTPPTMDFANSTRRFEMPPSPMRLPARMKKGTAASGNLSSEANACCATRTRGSGVKNCIPAIAASATEMATGTAMASSTHIEISIVAAMQPLR